MDVVKKDKQSIDVTEEDAMVTAKGSNWTDPCTGYLLQVKEAKCHVVSIWFELMHWLNITVY